MKIRNRTKVGITREGWYYLGMLGFIVAGAVIRDINLLYIMAGMMLGPIIFSWYWSTKSLSRIHLQRRFQKLTTVGHPLYVEIETGKPKGTSRAFAVIVNDRVSRSGAKGRSGVKTRLFFSRLLPGVSESASYRLTLSKRGVYRFGPVQISTRMPVGLVRATVTRNLNDSVLVSPKIGRLSRAWSRQIDFRNSGGQKSARRRGNSEGDFYGLREWRNGDSRNWIHWRTTAKRDKLTVRQFEQRINQDLVVILDLWHPKAENTEAIELAISFAATLVVEHGKQSSTHVAVAVAGKNPFRIQGSSSPVLRQELMERLATVSSTSNDELPITLVDMLANAASNSKVILICARDRDLTAPDITEQLHQRSDIRHSLQDIVQVNATSAEFYDWFHLDETSPSPTKLAPKLETEAAVTT